MASAVKSEKALPPLIQGDEETGKAFTQRIKNSARGYKARLTMVLQTQERLLAFFETNPSAFGALQLQDGLADIKEAVLPLQQRIQELMDGATSEEAYSAYEEDLGKYYNAASKVEDVTMRNLVAAGMNPGSHVTDRPRMRTRRHSDGSDGGNADGSKNTPRLNTALRPDKLTATATPMELRSWISQFKAYYAASHMIWRSSSRTLYSALERTSGHA